MLTAKQQSRSPYQAGFRYTLSPLVVNRVCYTEGLTIKRILLVIAAVVLCLALIEVVNLLELKANIGRYADYWRSQATASGNFTYVVLGDSAAQGLGASKPQLGYVG